MNPSDWTNAVKGAAITFLNGAWTLAVAVAVLLGWHPDVVQLGVVTAAVGVVINSGAALWLLITYRQSPARAQPHLLEERGLKP